MAQQGNQEVKPVTGLYSQTVELKNDDRARVSRAFVKEDGVLLSTPFNDVHTLYDGFRRGGRVSNDGECLGWRPANADGTVGDYKWLKYSEAIRRSENIVAGFLECGLEVGQQSFVVLDAANRPEWVLTEQACYVYNMVVVPLSCDTPRDLKAYCDIINQADIKMVVCDKLKKAEPLFAEKVECASLTHLIVMEPVSAEVRQRAKNANLTLMTFDELEELGAQRNRTAKLLPSPPKPEDLSTVCYPCGAILGTPKGVMLTHGNIVADTLFFLVFQRTEIRRDDTLISYLPLRNMFERLLESVCFMVGAKVGFYQGDIKFLTDDLKALRPTLLPVVPSLLDLIYDQMISEVNMVTRALFKRAMSGKQTFLGINVINDRFIFKKVREEMGGRVRFVVVGCPPLAKNILTFTRTALGCIVVEGYGRTECVAVYSATIEGDHTPGHLVQPVPCCKIKLVDVPEMNYFAKESVGEVCVNGPNVFKGYFKDERNEMAAGALDKDGWLYTGDIGRWTEAGTLKIVGRKPYFLVRAERIPLRDIESVYQRSKFVAQVFVLEVDVDRLIAVVVPYPDVLPNYSAKELGLHASMQELCQNETVKKMILDDMVAEGKKGELRGFEQVKDVGLCHELLENGLTLEHFNPANPSETAASISWLYGWSAGYYQDFWYHQLQLTMLNDDNRIEFQRSFGLCIHHIFTDTCRIQHHCVFYHHFPCTRVCSCL